jgi:hypothetical protein
MLMVMSQMLMWLFNYGFHVDMLMRIWHQAYLLCCTMYSSVQVDIDVWNVHASLVKDVDDSHTVLTKMGEILKKVSIEAKPILYYLRKVSVKQLYRFKSQRFCEMIDTSAFMQKIASAKRLYCFKPQNFSWRSDSRTLCKKFWINKAIESL